jgi:hypothetical protein
LLPFVSIEFSDPKQVEQRSSCGPEKRTKIRMENENGGGKRAKMSTENRFLRGKQFFLHSAALRKNSSLVKLVGIEQIVPDRDLFIAG